MDIRQWLNENSAVSTVVAIVVLVCALVYLMVSNKSQGASGPKQYWFYDLENKTLLAASTDEIAPIGTPSGGRRRSCSGVRVW